MHQLHTDAWLSKNVFRRHGALLSGRCSAVCSQVRRRLAAPCAVAGSGEPRSGSGRSSSRTQRPWEQRQQGQGPSGQGRGSGSYQPPSSPRPSGSAAAASRPSKRRRQQKQVDDEPVLDGEFLTNSQAMRLRRMVQSQGQDAVVDSQGFVKVCVDEPPADSSRQPWRSKPGARQSAADGAASSSSPVDDTGAAQQQQQQPPQQQALSLPVVRPFDGDKGTFFSLSSWSRIGASPAVQQALKQLGIRRPSHIQAESYPLLLSSAPAVALADQAGSGKTLAYLLPLLQQLKEAEEAAGGRVCVPNSPSIVVLTPTVELAQQVRRVLQALSGAGLRCRSAIATGGQAEAGDRAKVWRTQVNVLAQGVDVLVAGPGRAAQLAQAGHLNLSATRALVLDEVDVLCANDYEAVIAPLRAAAPDSMRCVLVSATLPQHVTISLQQLFPGLKPAFGPGLHRTAVGLTEELVDCSGGDVSLETGTQRKLEALSQALSRHQASRALVFCNKLETCRVVENHLQRAGAAAGRMVLPYHEAVRDDLRRQNLERFLLPPGGDGGSGGQQEQVVLVCTDRTSRGIDSMYCEHVVLFDFPRDPSEYVRRVGRTARGAGGKGVVSILVLGKQVPLAQEIITRSDKGIPVHRVPDLM